MKTVEEQMILKEIEKLDKKIKKCQENYKDCQKYFDIKYLWERVLGLVEEGYQYRELLEEEYENRYL